jgi:hypothetical protein
MKSKPLVLIDCGSVTKRTQGITGVFYEYGTPPFNVRP